MKEQEEKLKIEADALKLSENATKSLATLKQSTIARKYCIGWWQGPLACIPRRLRQDGL